MTSLRLTWFTTCALALFAAQLSYASPKRAIEFRDNQTAQQILLPHVLPADATFEGWIAPDECRTGANAYNVIFKYSNFFIFCFTTQDGPRIQLQEEHSGYNTISTPNGSLPISVWTHLAITFTEFTAPANGNAGQTDVSVFLNGQIQPLGKAGSATELLNEQTIARMPWRAGNQGHLGRQRANQNNHFVGGMDEIRIWSVARTAAEINSTMRQRLGGSNPPEGLVGVYTGDDLSHDANGALRTLTNGVEPSVTTTLSGFSGLPYQGAVQRHNAWRKGYTDQVDGDWFELSPSIDADNGVVVIGRAGRDAGAGGLLVYRRPSASVLPFSGAEFTLPPTQQEPPDATPAQFGWRVAIDERTVIVSAPGEGNGAGRLYFRELNTDDTFNDQAMDWDVTETGLAGDRLGEELAAGHGLVATLAGGRLRVLNRTVEPATWQTVIEPANDSVCANYHQELTTHSTCQAAASYSVNPTRTSMALRVLDAFSSLNGRPITSGNARE